MPDTYTLGRIELHPYEPRHLTQTEQRMMDGALRRSVKLSSPTPWHDPEDEFYGGIWWVPEGKGMRNASPGECAREIQRLRAQLSKIGEEMDHILRGNHDGWDRAMARIRDQIKGKMT